MTELPESTDYRTPLLGGWIQTFTGKAVFPLDLQPEHIDIRDIGHSLSNQCRFTGHVRHFLSTAEHSVRVSRLVEWLGGSPMEQMWGLIHDGGEAYMADMARPIKHMPEMAAYRKAEHRAGRVVAMAFGLPPDQPEIVHRADQIMLGIEARDLMAPLRPGWEWALALIPADYDLRIDTPWSPVKAEALFLACFRKLGGVVPGDNRALLRSPIWTRMAQNTINAVDQMPAWVRRLPANRREAA